MTRRINPPVQLSFVPAQTGPYGEGMEQLAPYPKGRGKKLKASHMTRLGGFKVFGRSPAEKV